VPVAFDDGVVPAARRRVRARLAFGLGLWVALWGVWLLLVDTLVPIELVAGAVAAAIAATVAEAVREGGYVRFSPRLRWLGFVPGLVIGVLRDCGVLTVALWREIRRPGSQRGLLIRLPFAYGDQGGRDSARRALVNMGVTLTPNTYVLDLDPEAGVMVVHQLVPGDLDSIVPKRRTAPTRRTVT